MTSKQLCINIKDEDRSKLEELCVGLDVSPQRGKSFVISKLIEHASVPGGKLDVRDFPDKEMLHTLREHFGNLSRVGGNLNQLVYLLQIRRLRLETGQDNEMVVEVPFLVAVLKELLEEIEEVKDLIADITVKY